MTRQKMDDGLNGIWFRLVERLVQQALIPWILWVSVTIWNLQSDLKDLKNHVCAKKASHLIGE